MIIKKFLFIIILVILIFWFVNLKRNTLEGFSQYPVSSRDVYSPFSAWNFFLPEPQSLSPINKQSITVQLHKETINPIKIYRTFYDNQEIILSSKIVKFFPIKPISIDNSPYQILLYINSNIDCMAFINEDMFIYNYLGINKLDGLVNSKYKKKNDYKPIKKLDNLRYVCAFYNIHFTLIAPVDSEITSWTDLKDTIIGTYANSTSFDNLILLIKLMEYKESDITVITYTNINDITTAFIEGKIDTMYLTMAHPNPLLHKISIERRIKLILTEGLPFTKLQYYFPGGWKSNIDTRYYMTIPYPNPLLPSYALRKILITNKDTNTETVYKFIRSLFENIIYLRQQLICMEDLQPYFMIYAQPLVRYHEGIRKFLLEMNYITFNPDIKCANFIGTGKPCTNAMMQEDAGENKVIQFGNPINYGHINRVSSTFNTFESNMENNSNWNILFSPQFENPYNTRDMQKNIFFNYARQINSGQGGISPLQ